jgi:hypothetical protein
MFKSIFKSSFKMTHPTDQLSGDLRFAPIPRDRAFQCVSTIFKVFRQRQILFYTFIFITSTIILCPQPSIYAADVTLAWTANAEPDLAGYYIYYKSGTSGAPYNGTGVYEGDSPIKVPLGVFADPANPEYTMHGLSDTEITFFVLTAYDTEDNESSFSNEVFYIDVPASNLPPDTPNIVYPDNYSGDVEVPLDITTAAFSDSNNDDHFQSQWQMSEQSDFSTRVVDITSDNYLTTFFVPHMVLKSNHKYYVRVRFFDIYFTASNWSSTVEFTTAYFFVDLNGNGISDADEVDETVDFNLDGIPDIYQPQIIKCVQASDGSVSIGIEKASSSVEEIESLEVIDPDTISDTFNRPSDLIFGLFAYRLRVRNPGDIATIRVYFSGDIFESDVFYKYDTINGWYDYSEHTTFNDDGQSITLEVKDGGFGDSDGLANGIIVDPGGIASVGDSYSNLGSNIVGCFIATAAFGSKFEKHVQLLRRFRDFYLMPNRIGRTFVKAYYKYSPPMADFIAKHDSLRAMVRISLLPVVGVSWIALKIGPISTVALMLFFISCFVGLVWFRRRYKGIINQQ